MISHARFGTLRLAQFLPDADISELENWDFMYHIWLGEAVGFSEWLRLEKDPGVLRSLAIAFNDFPERAAAEVLQTIGLPVRRGMRFAELCEILGEPLKERVLPASLQNFPWARLALVALGSRRIFLEWKRGGMGRRSGRRDRFLLLGMGYGRGGGWLPPLFLFYPALFKVSL